MINPIKRPNVVSEKLGDGLGIFDPQLQKSYMLNATSALVFQHCDGETTVEQLTDRLCRKFNVKRSQGEQMMWLALDELEKANLLQGRPVTTQAPKPLLSRRQALTAFAAAGLSLALLPVVASLSQVHAAPLGQMTTGFPTTAAPTTQPPTTVLPTTLPPTTTLPPLPSLGDIFTGFFAPVDNQPVVNEVKAGRGIPVKFSLGDNFGLNIIASGSPTSYPVACGGGSVDPIGDSETTNSPGGLSYDASSDQYTYVWKTEKSWAGSCRIFSIELTDPNGNYTNYVHTASFSFK